MAKIGNLRENRKELQKILELALGSKNVYYQPPENFEMNYPAIVYERSNIDTDYADDHLYKVSYTYQIALVEYDPSSDILYKLLDIGCRHNRHFTSEGLNHDIFTINFRGGK